MSTPNSSDYTAVAALAVAAVALCVTGAQVAQQYAASGEKIRLCDSSVYGPMPGKGRRTWNWVQLRFNVLYDMPQISINPDLWRLVHDSSAQNLAGDDDMKNLPNLLLSQASLEDSASILLQSSPWLRPLLILRHWGWRSLLTRRIPVKPHPEADYQFATISLTTLIATRGNPYNLESLQYTTEEDASDGHDMDPNSNVSERPQQMERESTMSAKEKLALLMDTPRWLWPVRIAHLWGWRTLFAWRIRLKHFTAGKPAPRRCPPELEVVPPVVPTTSSRIKLPCKRRNLRNIRQPSNFPIPTMAQLFSQHHAKERYDEMRREYINLYKDQRPSEASWVDFSRTMQSSCGSVLKYQMVKGDADRCPADLPVVPMLVSLRDVVVLCLMSGMDFTRTDIRNRLVSMEGAAGVLLSSTHPILGSVLRFIPRQARIQVGQSRDRKDVRLITHPAWLRRVVGRQDSPPELSLESINKMLVLRNSHHDLVQASRGSVMQQEDNALPQYMEPLAQLFGDVENPTSTRRSRASSVRRPWELALGKQQAIRSWTDAWPSLPRANFLHAECNGRNLERRDVMQKRLSNARADENPHWSWASKIDTVRGFWATPWASQFDAIFCTKAQVVLVEGLRLLMDSQCLHFANPHGRPANQPPDFLYPAVTTIPYGEMHRSLTSPLLKELPELRATKEIQLVDGFDDYIPPLMLVDFLAASGVNYSNYTTSGTENTRSQIETDELMWIDSWLIEVAHCSDIQDAWLKDLDFRVHEAIELFHEDFQHQPPIEPIAGTSLRRKLGRAAMEYAQGSAIDLLVYLELDLDLSHAQQIYFLAAMLRTFKTAYCIATGVNTKDAKEIFEKEISVYFA